MKKRFFWGFLVMILAMVIFIPKKSYAVANVCTCEIDETITSNNCNSNSVAECHIGKCTCIGKPINVYCSDGKKINTALGCVSTDFSEFIEDFLPMLFGIFGGVAFLLMVYGFILMGTSSGDEKKVQGAKETITSAVIGLIVSVSALFILKLIAVDILQIPGFL